MASSIVGIGLVGLGDISRKRYIPQILNSEHARLTAVCSQHKSSYDGKKADVDGARWYSDYRELVAQPDVDAVIVATPPVSHAEVAVHALAANKHVLIEKPVATHWQDALAIADAAKKSSAVVMALPWKRGPIDELIVSVIRRGLLGEVVSIRMVNGVNGPLYRKGSPDPDWAFRKRSGGGVLLGHGVYGLFRIATIVGPATAVTAEMAVLRPKRHIAAADAVIAIEVEDYCAMSLELGTKQDVTFECGWTQGGPCDALTITGTKGVLMSPARSAVFIQGHDQAEDAAALRDLKFSLDDVTKLASVRASELAPLHPMTTVVDDFVDAIRNGEAPSGHLDRALHITEQMTAAYESNATGGVRVPLTTTFAPSSGLSQDLFAIGDRVHRSSPRADDRSDVDALRAEFAEKQLIVLRSFFTADECDDIVEWADFKDGRLGNCFGDPDSHPSLSRVNAKLADIFGRNYTHIQTAVHYSSGRSPNTHNIHIDFPQRLFAYSPEDNLQIWALVRACGLKPDDTLLNLWTGFRPDASKTFDRTEVSKLEQHEIKGLTVGDVLVFSSWLPHSSGSIDHAYQRYAFKVHYYSDRAALDRAFLRTHVRDAIRVSSKETHNGTATALFAAEKLLGKWSRPVVKYPLALYRRRQTPNKSY